MHIKDPFVTRKSEANCGIHNLSQKAELGKTDGN